ncbi:MAG: hypothetical protein ACLR7Z_05405 [Bilophila wadsworthia]
MPRLVFITGGLHLDGVADARRPPRGSLGTRLEIMKDSGGTRRSALFFVLALKARHCAPGGVVRRKLERPHPCGSSHGGHWREAWSFRDAHPPADRAWRALIWRPDGMTCPL